MSLLIDDREDPRLIAELDRFDVPVITLRLDWGDVCWEGSGPDGRRVLVGFEHKRLLDLIACIEDRRLAGSQLVGMFSLYDRVEIVVEGLWRPNAYGSIEVAGHGRWEPLYFRSQGISYRQVDSYLQSLSECAGVRIWRTASYMETAHLYVSRYHWWQKPYHQHHSHGMIYSTDPMAQRKGALVVRRGPPGPVVQVAAQIPGIDQIAWSLGEQFASVYDLVTADERQWRETTWTDSSGNQKHFGRKRAAEIVRWLRNNKQN